MTTERPILFSAPMVRAMLNGAKTQTRRAVRKQFGADAIVAEVAATTPEGWQVSGHSGLWWDDAGACIDDAIRSPYGMPGDRLWVRETHIDLGACFLYRADHGAETERALVAPGQRWRPAIHMPRAASRILLEVTGVRVERLQDISEADAQAEGIAYSERFNGYCIGMAEHFNSHDPRQSYFSLWEAINGPGSVEANPWVWCVEFLRVTP